jgi:hypothetical protein
MFDKSGFTWYLTSFGGFKVRVKKMYDTKIDVGFKVVLNCGIEVEVVKVDTNLKCTVKDTLGNSKTVFKSQLRTKAVRWAEFGVVTPHKDLAENHLKDISVGKTFETKDGVTLTVTKYEDCMNVTVTGPEGEKRITTAFLVRKGFYWDKGINGPCFLRPKKGFSYVYMVHFQSELLYIGKGKGLRYLHTVRGTSHVRELNELHFQGLKVDVSIYKDGISNMEAEILENKLISELLPKYNRLKKNDLAT